MGKGGAKAEVVDYYMSIHFGVCMGAVDKIKRIFVGEKEAWSGAVTTMTSENIYQPELFGGAKKEGGVGGTVHFLPGEGAQVLPDALAQRLGRIDGNDCPGFRGVTSLFFTGRDDMADADPLTTESTLYSRFVGRPGFWWTSNQPYLQGVWVEVERAAVGLSVELAMIGPDTNPAHIIYECLTSSQFGMGAPPTIIDVDSFDAAAQTLFDEEFGLSMIWTRQSSVESFIGEVIDHIEGALFVNPRTGLLTLKLIRGDYDPATLPVLTPDNAKLSSFQMKGWGEIINEVIVSWTNPESEQEETVTAQDLGAIAAQGDIVSETHNYYGIRNATLAMKVAARDLRTSSAPLHTVSAVVDRTAWDLVPGDVVKLTWPEYGVEDLIMRVGPVDYGNVGDPAVKLSLVEDVFGLEAVETGIPPDTAWEDPSATPDAMTHARVITLPAWMVIKFIDTAATGEHPEAFAGIIASSDNADCFEFDAYAEVNDASGGSSFQRVMTGTNLARAELPDGLDAEATSTTTLANRTGSTYPASGCLAFIGADDTAEEDMEIALVTGVSSGVYTLRRGVLDTVPKDWPSTTPITFVSLSDLVADQAIRSDGEEVDYRLLTRTSLGLLAFDDADPLVATLTGRPHYPNRPADVKVMSVGFTPGSAEIDATGVVDPTIPVTWANRNRTTEDPQVLAWTDPTTIPEDGQTTTVRVYTTGGTLITEHTGLSGTSFNLPLASFGAENRGIVKVTAERDGFESLTGHELRVRVA